MILHETDGGKLNPTHFHFRSFVPACLYLMKSGLKWGGKYIIRRSWYLDQALPESNKLDAYGISKPGFTASKNHLLKSIRETIEKGHKTVEELIQFVEDETAKKAAYK